MPNTLMKGMIRSFEYFGGVTHEVLVDNQKRAVLEASNTGKRASTNALWTWRVTMALSHERVVPIGRAPKARMSAWWATSSTISSCAIARFESWAHLNQLAEQWLREEADLRVQGTVKEVVAERFVRESAAPQAVAAAALRYLLPRDRQVGVGWLH